jgi:hypothetical protein
MEELFESYQLDERLWKKGRAGIAVVAGLGWAGALACWFAWPERTYASWLVAFTFCTTIALGGLFFVMLQHLTGAAWSVTMRRMAENIMAAIPVGALLFIPVALGIPHLYHWPEEKAAWLNPGFFLLRTGIYFGLWSMLAWKLYRNSTRQDESGEAGYRHSSARWSAPGMVIAIVTVCLAAFDWLMSLDPHWYSTIFGVYVYSGGALAFIAALIAVLLALRRHDVLRYSVNHEHYHDLGKWLFGLTVFWAYIAFSQYLLIWYANLPEETGWFHDRLTGSWRAVAALLVIGHFLVPFFLLMSRAAKRRLWILGAAAGWVLVMHYVDLYWIAMPAFSKPGVSLHFADLAALAAATGTFALAFWIRLRKRALAPVGDAQFRKALEFTNA